jgi:hypothetical protein
MFLLGKHGAKNGKIQNEMNERTGNASKCYQVAKNVLWNKDTVYKENVKLKIYVYFKMMTLYGAEMWICTKTN